MKKTFDIFIEVIEGDEIKKLLTYFNKGNEGGEKTSQKKHSWKNVFNLLK